MLLNYSITTLSEGELSLQQHHVASFLFMFNYLPLPKCGRIRGIAHSKGFCFLVLSFLLVNYNFMGPMTASTQRTVLSLYARVFRIARSWQAHSGIPSDTEIERKYILEEARTLFRQNQQVWVVTLWWQKGVALHQWMTWLLFSFSAHRTRINKEVHRRMWSKNRNR